MSLELCIDTDPPVLSHTDWTGAKVCIGEEEIGLRDFCQLALYVLSNTDLMGEDDPRLVFIEQVQRMRRVAGWGALYAEPRQPEAKRLAYE